MICGAKRMPIAKRLYPILMGEKGELDAVEVDNTVRNAWMAVFALQEDVTLMQEKVGGALRRGEIGENDDAASLGKVAGAVRTIVVNSPTSITGVKLVSPLVNRLPFVNSSLQLDGGANAPEYSSSTKALTIRGALNITGVSTLTGAVTMAYTLAVTGAVTLTVPLAVPQGGTGAATFTDGGIMLGSGTGILTVLGQATDGQLPIGNTSSDPTLATITGTANEITMTNGSGTITLSQPTNVTIGGILTVTGDIKHDGSNLGVFGIAPVARAGAYTQTFSTADKTPANSTFAAVAETAVTQTTPYGFASQAQGDAVSVELNDLGDDVADLKQLVNAIIDDLQAYGLFQ